MASINPDTNALYEQLAALVDRGFPVLPLWGLRPDGVTCACPDGPKFTGELHKKHAHAKHPCGVFARNGVKSATLDKAILREWVRRHKGNWAVRAGCPMTDGRYLVCLDKDPRNGGEETLANIQGLRGELAETVTADTGGGGAHYLFGCEGPVASGSGGPGLDIIGDGKYFAVAPSKHSSGGRYTWSLGLGPDDVPIADAPAWLLEGASIATPRPPRIDGDDARSTILGEAFALAGMLGAAYPDGCVAVKCPWADGHSDGRGHGQDSSTVILPPAGGSRFGGYRCLHGSCSSRKWMDVLKALPPAAVAEAQRKYPLRPVAVDETVVDPISPEVAQQQKRDEMQDVRERLAYVPAKGGNGFKIVSDIVNLITVLSYDPRWKGLLRWDSFSQVLRWFGAPQWHADDKPKQQENVWTDADVARLNSWLRRNWALQIPDSIITQAVYVVGMRDSINPLRDWLNGLEWDKTARLDTWLSRYLGAPQTKYAAMAGSKWMISAIARAMQPGCKADHVLILEGPQGKGKSTALQILCGKDKFSDTPFDIGNKDAFMSLRGKWIVELAELASMSKTDADKIKAFFSSPSDYYRPPYGREMVDVPRQCVFAGSVNSSEYLRDETGNRRFWPVLCGAIDHDGLELDREQLWAEAIARYRNGESWWPSYEEREAFEIEQREREENDPWTPSVIRWAQSEQAKGFISRNGGITHQDVLEIGLGIATRDVTRTMQMRVASILSQKDSGFIRTRMKVAGSRFRGFRPIEGT